MGHTGTHLLEGCNRQHPRPALILTNIKTAKVTSLGQDIMSRVATDALEGLHQEHPRYTLILTNTKTAKARTLGKGAHESQKKVRISKNI